MKVARTKLPREIPTPIGEELKPVGPRLWEAWPWIDFTSIATVEERNLEESSDEEDDSEPERIELPPFKREAMLEILFEEFDGDRSGFVEAKELMQIGKARRELGQRDVPWTEKKTAALFEKIDADKDGKVDMGEFTAHFSASLPADREGFEAIFREFMFSAAYSKRPVDRITALNAVFLEFDYDRNGVFRLADLYSLGSEGVEAVTGDVDWSQETTTRLLREMDGDKDGFVSQGEFSSFFEKNLPKEAAAFDAVIQHFLQAARIKMAPARDRIDQQALTVHAARTKGRKRSNHPPQGSGNQECPEDATRLGRAGYYLDRPRSLPWQHHPSLSCGLGSKTWLDMVTRFYQKHQPSKVKNAAPMLESYKGREAPLVAKLYMKYALEPLERERVINGVCCDLRKPHDFIAIDLGASSPVKGRLNAAKAGAEAGTEGAGVLYIESADSGRCKICLGTGNATSLSLAILAKSGKHKLKQPGLPEAALAIVVKCFEENLSSSQRLVPVCSSLVSMWDVQGTAALCGPSSALANLCVLASHALRDNGYRVCDAGGGSYSEQLPHIVVYFPTAGLARGSQAAVIPMGWRDDATGTAPAIGAAGANRDRDTGTERRPRPPADRLPLSVEASQAGAAYLDANRDEFDRRRGGMADTEGGVSVNGGRSTAGGVSPTEGYTVGMANLKNPVWCVQSPEGGLPLPSPTRAGITGTHLETGHASDIADAGRWMDDTGGGWLVGAKSMRSQGSPRHSEGQGATGLAATEIRRSSLLDATMHSARSLSSISSVGGGLASAARGHSPLGLHSGPASCIHELDAMRKGIEAMLPAAPHFPADPAGRPPYPMHFPHPAPPLFTAAELHSPPNSPLFLAKSLHPSPSPAEAALERLVRQSARAGFGPG